ncbi:MAG: helix-turn-helix domain-containing protein [Oscillospiraceae bacterium]|nr:helix-turn-helix domain-containing protein [Oscillospiraceae bacterium]
MFNEYPDVMTVEQAAKALGISKNTMYKLIKDEVIKTKRARKRILVPKCCLEDYIKSARNGIQ